MSTESDRPESPQQLSSRTTPTWEMELLVSGATVFGLLQLPAVADRALFAMYNTTMPEVSGLVMSLWIYVKFTLYALIATFVTHLTLRGYWVALAGLASVYPAGIRWDKLQSRMGPIYFELSRRQGGDIREVIERADNRASRVFGVGFGMAMTMLVPILLVVALMGLMYAYRMLGGSSDLTLAVALGLFLVLMLPWGLVVLWDWWRGTRVAAGGAEGRILRALFRFYALLGFSRASNPLMSLYSSNEGGRRTGILVFVTMLLAFCFIVVQGLGDRLGIESGDYRGLPNDRPSASHVVQAAMYASQRGDTLMLAPPPHIPDPVVRGDYLRLFIPYFPRRHEEAMRLKCPEALAPRQRYATDAAIAANDAADRRRLSCLQALHPLAIDGVAVSVPFDAAEDPRTGQRGMLAMIPVRELAPGRHELTIVQAPRKPEPDDPTPRPYRIPFWR